jgi:hypothetical protein
MTDGDLEWFTLRELALSEARYDGAINITGFTVSDSLLRVQRDADGRLLAAGFRLEPKTAGDPAAAGAKIKVEPRMPPRARSRRTKPHRPTRG